MTGLETFENLPCLTKNYDIGTTFDYVPTLSIADSVNRQYTVSWLNEGSFDTLDIYFTAKTSEEAVKNAHMWCEENGLIR